VYALPDIIRVIKSRTVRWAGHVARMSAVRNAYNVLFRKPEGEIGWEIVDWSHLAEDRDQWRTLVNTVMNLRVPKKAGNFLTS
jgi:hypothetical protein